MVRIRVRTGIPGRGVVENHFFVVLRYRYSFCRFKQKVARRSLPRSIAKATTAAAVEASTHSYRSFAQLAVNEDVTIDADSDAATPRSSRPRPQDMPSTPQDVHVDWHQPLSAQLAGKQTEDDGKLYCEN